MADTYRPTRIRVERLGRWARYAAWYITEDIAEPVADEEAPMFRGLALECGPFHGLTHRSAWRRALRACGGRLY